MVENKMVELELDAEEVLKKAQYFEEVVEGTLEDNYYLYNDGQFPGYPQYIAVKPEYLNEWSSELVVYGTDDFREFHDDLQREIDHWEECTGATFGE